MPAYLKVSWAAAVVLAGCCGAAPSNPSPIGANIAGVADYGYTMPFVDVTRQARHWGSATSPWDHNCTVGADNWPAQAEFGNVFVTFDDTPYSPTVTGNWTIAFNGSATILPSPLDGGFIVDQQYDPITDSTVATMVIPPGHTNGIVISFANASTVAGGPGLKNIKVLQPGFTLADADKFTPQLLQLLSRFDVLRFMDWSSTNGNLIVNWTDRITPANFSYTETAWAVPWEVIIDLANMLQVDMHINVPAHANDDYILNLALLLNATAAPGIAVHVEYSNEVWNWSFEQATYNLIQANETVHAGDPYHFNDTRLAGVGNPGYWAVYRHVYMVKHIGDIFASVFGRANVGKDARIRPVYAWQMGNMHEVGLQYLNIIWGPPATILHSIAAAPYFSPGAAVSNNPNMTVDDIINGWTEAAANLSIVAPHDVGGPNELAVLAATASYWGIYFQGYEGGPDTVQGVDTGNALLAKANASVDPRIEAIVATYLRTWASYGNMMRPLNYFNAGAGPLRDQYGIYTLLTNMTVQDTPKLRGIDDARSSPTPVSPAIPSLPLSAYNASYYVGHPVPVSNSPFVFDKVKPFLLNAPTAMNVNVTAYVGSENSEVGEMSISFGGPVQTSYNVSCSISGSWDKFVPCTTSGIFSLPAGVNVLRLTPVNMSLWVAQFDVQVV